MSGLKRYFISEPSLNTRATLMLTLPSGSKVLPLSNSLPSQDRLRLCHRALHQGPLQPSRLPSPPQPLQRFPPRSHQYIRTTLLPSLPFLPRLSPLQPSKIISPQNIHYSSSKKEKHYLIFKAYSCSLQKSPGTIHFHNPSRPSDTRGMGPPKGRQKALY